jgi:D-sedoheptulose 7-phosphate isomerase
MAGTITADARGYLDEMAETLGRVDARAIDAFADCVYAAWRDGRRVFACGNGGSAYNASHLVTDLVKTASVEGRKRLAAFSLVDNTGLLTALGNDVSYDETFTYPLEACARPGDVLVAISCSGNSPNILGACRRARELSLTVVALTGFAGGKVKELADIHINIPSTNYGIMEDLHMSVGHVAAQALRARVAAEADAESGAPQPCAC